MDAQNPVSNAACSTCRETQSLSSVRDRSDIHGSAGFSRRIGVHRCARHVNLPDERFNGGNVPFQIGFHCSQEAQGAVVAMANHEERRTHRGALACRPSPPTVCAADHRAAPADQDRNPRHSCEPCCRCKPDTCENQRPAHLPPGRKYATRQEWIVSEALHTVQ